MTERESNSSRIVPVYLTADERFKFVDLSMKEDPIVRAIANAYARSEDKIAILKRDLQDFPLVNVYGLRRSKRELRDIRDSYERLIDNEQENLEILSGDRQYPLTVTRSGEGYECSLELDQSVHLWWSYISQRPKLLNMAKAEDEDYQILHKFFKMRYKVTEGQIDLRVLSEFVDEAVGDDDRLDVYFGEITKLVTEAASKQSF